MTLGSRGDSSGSACAQSGASASDEYTGAGVNPATNEALIAQLETYGRRLAEVEARLGITSGVGAVSQASSGDGNIGNAPTASSRMLSQGRESHVGRDGSVLSVPVVSKGVTFDQDLLQDLQQTPERKAVKNGATMGGMVLGLLSMPFGPVGMSAGVALGAIIGGSVGMLVDRHIDRSKMEVAEVQDRRLRSLVRFAREHLHEDDILSFIETITLEFKPIADVAERAGSKNAKQLMRLLDRWVSQKKVSRNLWLYMDTFLQGYHNFKTNEFIRTMEVFHVLTVMYHCTDRALSEQEGEFLRRMERLLKHESTQRVMQAVQMQQSEVQKADLRVAEALVFADAIRPGGRRQGSASGAASPIMNERSEADPNEAYERDEFDDFDDDDRLRERTISEPGSGHGNEHATPRVLVRKRPFFKGWEDFMNFDTSIKYRMPVTLSEFDLLLQKEKEPLKGWDVPVDREEIKIAKIQTGPNITLRAWACLPGVDMQVAFQLFYSTEERMKWDKTFVTMKLVQENHQGSDILYSLLKPPAVTPRDFLQYRRCKVQEDGSICIFLRSAEHANAPEDKRYIRAESYASGYVLRQTFDGDKPVLNVFLMSCVDIKGLVPKWIINMLAPKAPKEWVDNLRKAALDYQEANPGYREALAGQLEAYKEDNPFDYEDLESSPGTAVSASVLSPRGALVTESEELAHAAKPTSDGPLPISL